jgi:hypothetical protein
MKYDPADARDLSILVRCLLDTTIDQESTTRQLIRPTSINQDTV